ncbi:hypothetical protein HER21_34905, partial [Pseudomonas sp. BGM005]|nr:hypothetical protein [Pseudomonas sp. BG5]
MISFNEGWTVGPQVSIFAKLGGTPDTTAVTLPHDALISTTRAPENSGKVGYFPSAAFQYTKTFAVPEDWRGKHVIL